MTSSHECLSQLLVIEELIAAADWTSTEIMCTEAIADDAHNVKFFSNRGIARTHLHRHNEALEDFDLAISIDPINRTAILGRARALLNTGHVDDAGDVVTSVLEDDIGDREAHKLLKDVAGMKFRALFTKDFASGQRTQLSLRQISDRILNEKLNAEEMRLVRLELMRMWCDCIENSEIAPLLIKLIINLIGVTCSRLCEYKLSLLCFYLRYIAILEDPLSITTIEQVLKLRDISSVLIKLGNFDSARKIITLAINLDDPVADPNLKLTNQLILCQLQLQAGAIDEPLEKLAQIRKEAEERGNNRIVYLSDLYTLHAKMSNNQIGSAKEMLVKLRKSLRLPGALFNDTQRAEMEHFVNCIAANLEKNMLPTEFDSSSELIAQQMFGLIDEPPSLTPIPSNSAVWRRTNTQLRVDQLLDDALNALARGAPNKNDFEEAQRLLDNEIDERRNKSDTLKVLELEPISAQIDLYCGRIELSNKKFKRCINLARTCQLHKYIARISLYYGYALFRQLNLNEALAMTLESENSFLIIYQNTTSEDQKIMINEEKCMIGSLQILILVTKEDYPCVKALYACERYRMPFLRKDVQIPFDKDGPMHMEFISHLLKYCKINSSILVYLSGSYGAGMFCWIIHHDRIFFSIIPRGAEFILQSEQNANIGMMGFQMPGNSFRSFPISKNSNFNSETQRFLNFVGSFLWMLFSKDVLNNLSNPKRIVIIPDKKLHLIPFAILGNNSVSNSLSDYPLLKNFTISQSPSFWALSNTWMKEPNTSQNKSIERENRSLALIIGNPQSNLPAAEEEALLVTQNLKEHTELKVLKLTQHLATRDIVLDSLCHSKIVHIAAHGNLDADEQHVRAGAIHLEDGALYAKEIEELNLSFVELAFVNCCLGGLGKIYEEGPVGLTRALLLAGARNVIAYRGEVPDSEITCAFVNAFYDEWVKCQEADTALRSAQIKMLENGIDHDFWAGYIVIRQRGGRST